MIGNYRGKRLFSGRLFAGQLFGPIDTASGGGSFRRVMVPASLIDAQRLRMIEADDLLLLIAGSVAAGLLR